MKSARYYEVKGIDKYVRGKFDEARSFFVKANDVSPDKKYQKLISRTDRRLKGDMKQKDYKLSDKQSSALDYTFQRGVKEYTSHNYEKAINIWKGIKVPSLARDKAAKGIVRANNHIKARPKKDIEMLPQPRIYYP